jgi:hypothetical protein
MKRVVAGLFDVSTLGTLVLALSGVYFYETVIVESLDQLHSSWWTWSSPTIASNGQTQHSDGDLIAVAPSSPEETQSEALHDTAKEGIANPAASLKETLQDPEDLPEQAQEPVRDSEPGETVPSKKVTEQDEADQPKGPKLTFVSLPLPLVHTHETIVERFIEYDIGRLRGDEGYRARETFNRLGTEGIAAVVRGVNKSATISASCPIIVLMNKLQTLLRDCRDPYLVQMAVDHLGVGIPTNAPHWGRVDALKKQVTQMLPADHPIRRRQQLITSLTQRQDLLAECLRSDDAEERWAAARAIQIAGLPMGDELIRLIGDPEPAICQEARTALVRIARNRDFGPEPEASAEERADAASKWRSWWVKQPNSGLFRTIAGKTDTEIREYLKSDDPSERWTAAAVVRQRRLPYHEELIELLADPDVTIRWEARQTLVQLAGGVDYGPDEDAGQREVQRAVEQWTDWLEFSRLLAKYRQLGVDQLVAEFQHPDARHRLAAVRVAGEQRSPVHEALIEALRDDADEIAQEARHALVALAGGSDFGPSENADRPVVETAVARWREWHRWHRLVQQYATGSPASLLEAFSDEDPVVRWAAVAAARASRLDSPRELIAMLGDSSVDVQQEARQALLQLAEEYDFGPAEGAGPEEIQRAASRWSKWLGRNDFLPASLNVPTDSVLAALQSTNPLKRWAAATIARRTAAPLHEALVGRVADEENEVRLEARRALCQLADGQDYGPRDDAAPAEIESAALDWNAWWNRKKAEIEERARRQLRLAEAIVEKNPEAAQRRLSEIIAEFPETEAAEEARQWLTRADFQSQQPAADGRAGDATQGKRGSDRAESVLPVAESESPVSPEQLEREANMFLRMSLAELSHRPIPLRARMRELMQRYPNTKAAAFAQRAVEAINADMQQNGNAPSLQDEAGAASGTSGD